MSVLFCDTDCELWYTTAKELDLKVIEMPYTIDGEETLYDLGENTDFKGFFKKMEAGSVAMTSGLNSQTYYDIFEPYFKAGEEILYIAFSSKMSSTFKYLELAINELKEKYPNARYRKFDTLNICMGAGLMVYMAGKFFHANGGDIDKTYDYLENIVQNISVLFVVDNLKYLARGGRISENKARIGNLMQVKPILNINKDGEIDVYAKQNGQKKAMHFVLDELDKNYKNIDNAPIVVVNANCEKLSTEIVSKIKEKNKDVEVWTQPVGPVIGAHCGPGTYGVIFTSNGR